MNKWINRYRLMKSKNMLIATCLSFSLHTWQATAEANSLSATGSKNFPKGDWTWTKQIGCIWECHKYLLHKVCFCWFIDRKNCLFSPWWSIAILFIARCYHIFSSGLLHVRSRFWAARTMKLGQMLGHSWKLLNQILFALMRWSSEHVGQFKQNN